jgi:hypothetical protein
MNQYILIRHVHPRDDEWVAKVTVMKKLFLRKSQNTLIKYQKIILADAEVTSFLHYNFNGARI